MSTTGSPYQGDLLAGLREAVDLIAGGDPVVISTTLRTLRIAVESTTLAAAAGLPLGCLLGIGRFRGRSVLLGLANGLTKVPPVAIGVLVVLLVYPSSPWGGGPLADLRLWTTTDSAYLAQALLAAPIIVALTATAVQSVSPALLEQARAFDAPGWRRAVLALREARAAVLAGVLVAMGVTITAIGAIVVANASGNTADGAPATLATGALSSFHNRYGDYSEVPRGVAFATILLGVFVLLAAGLTRLQRDRPAPAAASVVIAAPAQTRAARSSS